MGDRKVLNKYIPSDFDPKLVPRGKKLSSRDGTVPVRMMLPFSIQCLSCNTFLYRGRKFNSKKEAVQGAHGKYLGIQRLRFYIKCTQCSKPITFLTDPKNADYEMESGATRNFEATKDNAEKTKEAEETKEEEEKMDPMKALENRVLESQQEMAEHDNLEEIKAMNARHIQLAKDEGYDAETQALKRLRQAEDELIAKQASKLSKEDEELVKSIKFGKRSDKSIQRLNENDEKALEERRREQARQLEIQQKRVSQKTKPPLTSMIKVKRKCPVGSADGPETKQSKSSEGSNAMASLLGGYGSSSSEED